MYIIGALISIIGWMDYKFGNNDSIFLSQCKQSLFMNRHVFPTDRNPHLFFCCAQNYFAKPFDNQTMGVSCANDSEILKFITYINIHIYTIGARNHEFYGEIHWKIQKQIAYLDGLELYTCEFYLLFSRLSHTHNKW